MTVQPIKPSQVIKKQDGIPDFVIESINELIAKNFRGNSALIKQDELVSAIHSKMPEGSIRQDVFDNNWLDIENIFDKAGWRVTYNKPGYNEAYPATFEFFPKKSAYGVSKVIEFLTLAVRPLTG